MNEHCSIQGSEISDVLNDSILTSSLDFDRSKDIFEVMMSKTISSVETSSARSFLLTMSHSSDCDKVDSTQLIVTFEDFLNSHDNKHAKYNSNDTEYKDNNISIQNIHSILLPSKEIVEKKTNYPCERN